MPTITDKGIVQTIDIGRAVQPPLGEQIGKTQIQEYLSISDQAVADLTVGTTGSPFIIIQRVISGSVVGSWQWAMDSSNNLTLDRIAGTGIYVWNELGASVDYRFEGNTDTELLFLDGSEDRVGFSTTTPATLVDIQGALTVNGILSQDDTTNSTSGTSGSIHTDGGLGVLLDLAVGDDLLLVSSGAVINFNAGDVTLTHSAAKLTWGGDGAVEIDFNDHEMTNVDIDSGAIDGTTIGGASAAAGTFAGLTVSSGTITATGLSHTPGLNTSGVLVNIDGTLVEHGSGTHVRMSVVEIAVPTITTDSAAVTDAATLYIAGATGTSVSGTDNALWVDDGTSRFDGDVMVGDGITLDSSAAIIVVNGTDGFISSGSVGISEAGSSLYLSSAINLNVLLDNDNNASNTSFRVFHNTTTATGTPVFTVNEAGLIVVNGSTNANMAVGLTIYQLGNDNQVLAFNNADVTTGITTATNFIDVTTSDYAVWGKTDNDTGGLLTMSMGENAATSPIMLFESYGGTATTTKSTAGRSLVEFYVTEHTGSALDNIATDGNIFGIRARVGAADVSRWILDEDGDTWQAGAITTIGDLSLDGDLDFQGPQAITTSSGDLTLNPSGDVACGSNAFTGMGALSATSGAFSANITITKASTPALRLIDTTNNAEVRLEAGDTQGRVGTDTSHDFIIQTNDTTAITVDTSQDVTLVGDLTVSGTGPHAIGGATDGHIALFIRGAFTSDGGSNDSRGTVFNHDLTGFAGDTDRHSQVQIAGSITTQTASNDIAVITSLQVNEPNITDNLTGEITVAATVHIVSAPDEGEDNYALWVDAGAVQIDDTLTVGGAVGTGPLTVTGDAIITDQVTIGGAIEAGSIFNIEPGVAARDILTSVGTGLHIEADSQAINAAGNGETVAIGALAFLGIPTWTSVGTTFTISDAATLYIQGPPVDSTNVTHTREYALWVDNGNVKFDGDLTVDGTVSLSNNVTRVSGTTTDVGTAAATSETTLHTVTVPANAMGTNGGIRIIAKGKVTGTANTKLVKVKVGGVIIVGVTFSAGETGTFEAIFHGFNRNAANDQKWAGLAFENAVPQVLSLSDTTIDTTAAMDITVTGETADAADEITAELTVVELISD